jgi:hypothetical protein
MDELTFKRHLRDLVHGRHHPEEHDWGKNPPPAKAKGGRRRQSARKGSAKKRS